MMHLQQVETDVKTRSSFTGKELDEETGYGYFGARYYDPTLLTGWTAVDPMADKYPSLSPYNYCAWNPVKLVDPDGRTIVITGEDGIQYTWKGDKLYRKIGRANVEVCADRAGKYVSSVAGSLKQINSTKEGKTVLSQLSSSKTTYSISNKQKNNTDACFSHSDNTLYLNGHTDVSSVSHEMFHAYQHDNGRDVASIYNEVEAYVFQGIVENRLGIKHNRNSGVSSSNDQYRAAAERLMDNYNPTDFKYMVSHFRLYSNANKSGTYKEYSYTPKGLNGGNSLLKKL